MPRLLQTSTRLLPVAGLALVGCQAPTVDFEGQLGRPIPLAVAPDSTVPWLAFVDEGCPGDSARGGCRGRACEPLLVDSLSPLTALQSGGDEPQFTTECLEVRAAGGLGEEMPADAALDAAVARFRFHELPLVRAPQGGGDDWQWGAGIADVTVVEPGGVLGGNVLRQFAVAFRSPGGATPTVTLYGEYPGDERKLADEGRAFIALQFPGTLLGRDIGDQCDIGGEPCKLDAFDFGRSQRRTAIVPTQMVVDACVGVPPCTLRYDVEDPLEPGTCRLTQGPASDAACDDADDQGSRASLVVATAVPGIVLFRDSVMRMFPDPEEDAPSCGGVATTAPAACWTGESTTLQVSGWPPAPAEVLRVRSLGLVPGLTETRGEPPCVRLQQRRTGLRRQCEAFVDDFEQRDDIRDTTPPYAGAGTDTAMAVLGEVSVAPPEGATANPDGSFTGQPGAAALPDTNRWIETYVIPATHPIALATRRAVAPQAIEPDGLVGTVLFENTETVLDYTDAEAGPGVRVRCLDPEAGDCLVAPSCGEDAQPACCFGLPLNLLVDFIMEAEDETCCVALTGEALAEIQAAGRCLGVRD